MGGGEDSELMKHQICFDPANGVGYSCNNIYMRGYQFFSANILIVRGNSNQFFMPIGGRGGG